jgi:hypothetical protein
MSNNSSLVSSVAKGFVSRFGEDCGSNLEKVAATIGLYIENVDAESFDGVLLRIAGVPRGTVVLNRGIREPGRRLFTLAHEIGHYILPNQQHINAPCLRSEIAQWAPGLSQHELEANEFASEILLPISRIQDLLVCEPTFDAVVKISDRCKTTLTASAHRFVSLSSFRIALVWSSRGRSIWYKASKEFGRAVELKELSEESYAYDCFKKSQISKQFERVPASAWLYDSNLRDGAEIFEHSLLLPYYESVISLLYIKDRIERKDDYLDDENLEEMDPGESGLGRKRWPRK